MAIHSCQSFTRFIYTKTRHRLRSLKFILITLFSILLLASCVTKKKKGDVSKTKRAYHNMTAYYNAYFNANELVEESLLNMKAAHVDNYNTIIGVYDYTNLTNPKMEAESLDKAIEKVSTSASLHRISQWVDDCYVMIGRCQFYKQDFETAEETFLFFEEEFNPNNPYGSNYESDKKQTEAQRKKARKEREKEKVAQRKVKDKEKKERSKSRKDEQKEREKARKQAIKDRKKGKRASTKGKTTPKKETVETTKAPKEEKKATEKKDKEENEAESIKKGPFKHIPAYYEAMYWLGRTLIEREKFSTADFYFEEILKSPAKTEIKKLIPAARAHLYLKKGDYEKAVRYLDEAIEVGSNRKDKGRYSYIKAQIHEKNGNNTGAFAEYKKSRDYKPGFEMDFHSSLNEIKLSQSVGKISSKNAINKLERMGKEDKYAALVGPVHNAIGEILLKDGDMTGAIEQFKYASTQGQGHGQVDSYYQLATLLFKEEDYIQAKQYYDQALDVMPKSDSRYAEVKSFANNLTEISQNIQEIELQDSLLLLSEMTLDELYDLAREDIKNQPTIDETESSPDKNSMPKFSGGRSNFFAYNPVSIEQGMSDYVRVWGRRNLVDNWRTAEGEAFNQFEDFSESEESDEVVVTDAEIEQYLKDVPRSSVQKELARRKIMDARYNLGILYRDKMAKIQKSTDELTSLLSNYPTFQEKEKTFFYLYLNHSDLNNKTQAQYYRNLLKKEFPDSEFTKIATDPNYAKKLAAEANTLESYYNDTYSLFEKENHEEVLTRVSESTGKFGDENEFSAKFALLQAMSLGNVEGEEAYLTALKSVSKNFPNTPESVKAKEILRFFTGNKEAFSNVMSNEGLEDFKVDDDALHYNVVIVYGLTNQEVDEVKVEINKFNNKFFKESKLSNLDLGLNKDDDSSIILIRKFGNKKAAMKYYDICQKSSDQFIQSTRYEIFPINQRNYREIIKQRSINSYKTFFEKEYLGN